MSELYTEHLDLAGGITHNRFEQLVDQNRRPEYQDLRVIPSESEDHYYLVATVEALDVPFQEADIAEDQTEIHLCSCDDHWYNQSDSIENPQRTLSDVGQCKHITAEYRELKAKNDDNQERLL